MHAASPSLDVAHRVVTTLSLQCVSWLRRSGGLGGEMVFSSALITEDGAQRMAQHFSNLLSSVVTAPQEAVSRLGLMDAAERELTMRTFNATDAPLSTATMHSLFEATVVTQPDDCCLVGATAELSYIQARTLPFAIHFCAARPGHCICRHLPNLALHLTRPTSNDSIRSMSGPISWRTT